jgi:agmatine deiminase
MSDASDGWRMPADFEKHECTWLAWPNQHHHARYTLKYERSFLELTEALKRYEPVRICACDEAHAEHILHQFSYLGLGTDNIEIFVIPTNDIWVCDSGPLVVVNEAGERAIVNWQFNGWGGRYRSDLDGEIPRIVAEKYGLPLLDAKTTVETGFEVNGKGSLLITRTSVLNPNRNPDLSQQEIEAEFEKFLGVTNPIWLTGVDGNDPVLGPEETDCHIDLMCRFVNEDTVLYGWHEQVDESDPAFQRVFSVMLDELRNARSEADKPLNLVPVPAPKHPVYSTNAHAAVGHIAEAGRGILAACGPKMWYSGYMDWHVANGVVLVPILGDVNDERALAIIGEHFPGRDVIGIDGRTIMEGGGGFHCITKPQAATPA